MEVELQKGTPEDLKRFVRRLRRAMKLRPGHDSKFEYGLHAAGIEPPALADADRPAPDAGNRFGEVAHHVLEQNLRRLLWNEPGTRLGLDPEKLHDMRVAARRMRAALRVFGAALPPREEAALRKDLAWVGAGLGRVRDLDVYLLTLQEDMRRLPSDLQPALDDYRKCIRMERERARKAMLRMLLSARFGRFRRHFQDFFAAAPAARDGNKLGRQPVTTVAPDLIRGALKKVLKSGRQITVHSPEQELHELRIRCKRLRYVCEFLADVYGAPALRLARRIAAFQDVLGTLQDATVAQRMINAFISGALICKPCSQTQYFALGQLMAWKRHHALSSRQSFLDAWQRFDRRKVREPLLRALKQTGRRQGSAKKRRR